MEEPRKTFVPGPRLRADSLNREFDKHVLGVHGDGQCILVKRYGQVVTVSLAIDALLARIPKGVTAPFYVNTTMISGSAGTQTTQCAFVYELTDDNGNVVGNTLSVPIAPSMQRPAIGKTTAAKIGIARYKPGGVIQLIWCDEVPTKAPCPST